VKQQGRIEGITGLDDESDRNGMRIVIDRAPRREPERDLNQLLQAPSCRTASASSCSRSSTASRRSLTLIQILHYYIKLPGGRHHAGAPPYELKKAQERAHILEGLTHRAWTTSMRSCTIDPLVEAARSGREAERPHGSLQGSTMCRHRPSSICACSA
jgi:DNA gyrase/topoisomerase IV subunit A